MSTSTLNSSYVVPGYTFFYYGFTLQKSLYPEYIKHFKLTKKQRIKPIKLKIKNKIYDAKIRLVSIDNSSTSLKRSKTKYPVRDVVQIYWQNEQDTLKALRKLMIYSYASTRNKATPKIKELLEFVHSEKNTFRIKVLSKQETDFDEMFRFLEDKNL